MPKYSTDDSGNIIIEENGQTRLVPKFLFHAEHARMLLQKEELQAVIAELDEKIRASIEVCGCKE